MATVAGAEGEGGVTAGPVDARTDPSWPVSMTAALPPSLPIDQIDFAGKVTAAHVYVDLAPEGAMPPAVAARVRHAWAEVLRTGALVVKGLKQYVASPRDIDNPDLVRDRVLTLQYLIEGYEDLLRAVEASPPPRWSASMGQKLRTLLSDMRAQHAALRGKLEAAIDAYDARVAAERLAAISHDPRRLIAGRQLRAALRRITA